jgi:hypothetical protein
VWAALLDIYSCDDFVLFSPLLYLFLRFSDIFQICFFCVSPSVQGANVLGKQFQKMRRRLTVTGASQSIDGVIKPGVAESGELKKYKGKKQDKVR